jgi:hypothetical protein
VPFNGKIRALQWAFSKIVVEEQKLEDSGFFLSCFKSAEKAKLGFSLPSNRFLEKAR